jgi:hypothetical protein
MQLHQKLRYLPWINGFWKIGDKMFKYGKQSSSFDPTRKQKIMTPMKASTYALKNLKYVAENLFTK